MYIYIYTVVAKIIRTLVFKPAKKKLSQLFLSKLLFKVLATCVTML